MRTLLLGLALAALATYLSWYWVIADRDFERYAEVEIGMALDIAEMKLEREGWLAVRVHRGGTGSVGGRCGPGKARSYVEGASPDYTLVIHTDDECIITKITRRTRTLEL